jgi:hypothetical protein
MILHKRMTIWNGIRFCVLGVVLERCLRGSSQRGTIAFVP